MEQCERQRNSSIELLRIVAMMFIIMNHFAGHGVFEPLDKAGVVLSIDTITWQIVFTQLFNWGGGLGNTLFILITGYFMINKVVNYKKILLLLATMLFYSWTIEILVYGLMGMPYNIKDIIRLTMPICFGENWFVSCYIIFSLFIPYINIFLNNIDKIKHLKLLCILFVFLIFLPALRFDTFMQGQLLFFGFCYAVGGYLRLYSQKYITNEWHNRYLTLFVLLMILMTLSIFLMDIVGVLLSKSIFLRKASYFGVIMKIPVAITLFLYFITMKSFFNKYINILAGTVLGVYLIHDNRLLSNVIWNYIFPNIDWINFNYYPLFYLGKVIMIFGVCSLVDYLRKVYVEAIYSKLIDKYVIRIFNIVSQHKYLAKIVGKCKDNVRGK